MTTIKLLLATLSFFLLNNQLNAQHNWVSPCPRLFVYEGKSNEPNKWYGIITLLSNTDLSGVWIRIIFDRPALSLGNWFGKVKTEDHIEYLVHNHKHELKAHVPETVRFYVAYNPDEPPPKLVLIRLNARTICPEGGTTEAPSMVLELQTSSQIGDADVGPGNSFNKPQEEPISQKPPVSVTQSNNGDEEFYQGDFYNLFNQQKPIASKDNEELTGICGTVITQPRPLITNGQETREGEFPWHAALYYAKALVQMYICGASLVSKSHVITAAHCVTKSRTQTPVNPDNLVVYLGKYQLKRFTNVGIQDREVSEIIPHPQYSGQNYKNDIALLKLATEVDITDYVRPICLWQDSPDINEILNKQGSVVGWGFDETGKLSEELMQAHMPVVSQSACLKSFPDFYSRFTSDHTYCAGFRNGTSVCNGDSGGGMVFSKQDSKSKSPIWQLRGLVSISVALQNQPTCDTSNYVVFTDTAKYLDWIRKSIK